MSFSIGFSDERRANARLDRNDLPRTTGRSGFRHNHRVGKSASIPCLSRPLAEQKRIVAKVDELMALCDRLEAQQQERETRHAELARASLARFADAPTPANLDFLFHQVLRHPPRRPPQIHPHPRRPRQTRPPRSQR